MPKISIEPKWTTYASWSFHYPSAICRSGDYYFDEGGTFHSSSGEKRRYWAQKSGWQKQVFHFYGKEPDLIYRSPFFRQPYFESAGWMKNVEISADRSKYSIGGFSFAVDPRGRDKELSFNFVEGPSKLKQVCLAFFVFRSAYLDESSS